MKLCSALILILLITVPCYSQSPAPYVVTSKDFLGRYGAISVNDIECGPQGYLYFATNTGVYKFNGYELPSNQTKNYDKSFVAIHKGYYGNLWFTGHLGISRLFKDSLFPYPIPEDLIKLSKNGFESVYYDQDHFLHLAPKGHGHYVVDSLGQSQLLFGKNDTLNAYIVKQLDDGTWFHFSIISNNKQPWSVYHQDYSGKLQLISHTNEEPDASLSKMVSHKDGSNSLTIGSNLVLRFKQGELMDSIRFSNEISELFVDKKNDLWISTVDSGVCLAKNSIIEDLTKYKFHQPGAVIAESYDGGLWMKHRRSGFSLIPQNRFLGYGMLSGYEELDQASSVYPVGDSLLISTRLGNLNLYYQGKVIPIDIPEKNRTNKLEEPYPFLGSFYYDELKRVFWFSFEAQILKWDGINWTSFFLDEVGLENQIFTDLKYVDGRIIINSDKMLFEIKDDRIEPLSEIDLSHLSDFVVNDSGDFYIGQSRDISKFENGTFSPLQSDLDIDGVFIMFNHENVIGIVTIQSGALYRIKDDIIIPTLDQNGKQIDLWNHCVSKDGTIWGVTRGMDLVHMSNFTEELVNAEYFELPQYVCAGMMKNSVVVQNNNLYIASYNGFFIKELSSLEKLLPKSHLVIKTQVNSLGVDYKNAYTLNYDQNNLYFEFDAIGFNLWGNTFQYQFSGYDSTWREVKHKHVQYTNLDPGEYTFSLKSKISYGDWSNAKVISFFIAKPYWETWWFRIAVTLSALLIIYLIIRLRIRQVQNREREKSRIALELARLEMKALKAQINPHFIFNSITSAMFYLSQNENVKAESYLQRFSKLIRRVLESSDQTGVKLLEEVELMRHYISLESEQFEGEAIRFDVVYNEINPEEIKIPPTLIQPYIENAIRHGLQTKNGKRLISLSFQVREEILQVIITDNGIGRIAAQKLNHHENQKSYGMLISSRRIEVLNQNEASGIHVEDLYDADKNSMGTQICFKIPLPNKSEMRSSTA